MSSARIRFSIVDAKELPSRGRDFAQRFWDELCDRSPELRALFPRDEEDRVLAAEREIRTRFPMILSERLREFLGDAGAGLAAGAVACRVERIEYHSLEVILEIIKTDIVAQALGGSLDLLMGALDSYALEAFAITFPCTEDQITAATTATPALMAAFAGARRSLAAVSAPASLLAGQDGELWRRQWRNANAALVLPAMLAFLVLLAFGFYLLHLWVQLCHGGAGGYKTAAHERHRRKSRSATRG